MMIPCPHCASENTKKNGQTHYNKQNYKCNDCGRQYVENGQDWFVSEVQKGIIDRLLLERLSLAGISRAVGVSESWLYQYLDQKYDELPDHLNVVEHLPDSEAYLADRMDEEIDRIQKKSR